MLLRSPGLPGSPWPIHAVRANFEVDLTGSLLFDPSWREKRNGTKFIALSWWEKKLFTKNYFAWKCVFLPKLMTCVAWTVDFHVNPHFWPKMTEHDIRVILCSAILGQKQGFAGIAIISSFLKITTIGKDYYAQKRIGYKTDISFFMWKSL